MDYQQFLQEAGNVHLAYYLQAAHRLGIEYKVLVHGLLAEFTYEAKHWFIINTVTPLTNTPSTTIAKRKNLTNLVLREHGLSVPDQIKCLSLHDVVEFANRYSNKIVVKPLQNLGGVGITILPRNEEEARIAYEEAYKHSKAKGGAKVLAEEFFDGVNYRFLTLDTGVIGIVRRLPATVVGDGQHTIRELIEISNDTRKKSMLEPIRIDNEVDRRLSIYNMTLDSILSTGKQVLLRFNSNLTTGGTTEECFDEVHAYYKEIARKALNAIDAKFGGIDFIIRDISKPGDYIINEINYNPGLRLHYKVQKGKVVDVAKKVLERILDMK